MSAPVIIAAYDPHWPRQFEVLCSRISSVLGTLALAIEHVGSTAVPGLAAKPIIDIDVMLRSAADLSTAITLLATLGYHHEGDKGVAGREAFRAPPNDLPHHLYIHGPASREYGRHITFRNHMRANPVDAQAYEHLKRRLAGEYRNDRQAYNRAKTEFIEAILRRARPTEQSSPASRMIP